LHTLNAVNSNDSVVSSGLSFYSNDAQKPPAVTATGKMLVSDILASVLFDTGAGRSCTAPATATRMIQ
jgi:hypothetical protein